MSDERRTFLGIVVISAAIAVLAVAVAAAVGPIFKALGETATIVFLVAALVAIYFIYTGVMATVHRRKR